MSLTTLKTSIERSPTARARFFADFLNVLERHGVKIDEATLKELGLDHELRPTPGSTVASTNIITITR